MIIQVERINLRGPLNCLRATIDTLKSSGAFSLSTVSKQTSARNDSEICQNLTNVLSRIRSVLDYCDKASRDVTGKNTKPSNDMQLVDYATLKKVSKQEAVAIELINKYEELSAKFYDIKAEIKKTEDLRDSLIPYSRVNIPLDLLSDTEHATILFGIMQDAHLKKFTRDYDLAGIHISTYKSGIDTLAVVAIAHKEDEALLHAIFDYGFERCKLNFPLTASEKIAELNTEIEAHKKTLKKISAQSVMPIKDAELLKLYYDHISNELDTEQIMASTLCTEQTFILNGYVVKDAKRAVLSALQVISRNISTKTSSDDDTPVIVRNSKIIAPYQSITNMYGAPSTRDLDPNIFVAFFYFLFFGVMISDIGYGIIMSLVASAILIYKAPKSRGARDLVSIILMGGISAIIWGMLFGSVFGAETGENGVLRALPRGMLNPINEPLIFLGLAFALGLVHILFGTMLKTYNLARRGQLADAIFDGVTRIMLLAGSGIYIGSMALNALTPYRSISLTIAIIGLATLILTSGRKSPTLFGKISGGASGVYSVINYVQDILSYARLFGLGLVGAVIALVANKIGGMVMGIAIVGAPLGILVALFFHSLNLALGLLSAYVHNARLQFVEFFGKFYEGSGKLFTPLTANLKFVKIKGEIWN